MYEVQIVGCLQIKATTGYWMGQINYGVAISKEIIRGCSRLRPYFGYTAEIKTGVFFDPQLQPQPQDIFFENIFRQINWNIGVSKSKDFFRVRKNFRLTFQRFFIFSVSMF